MLGIRHFVDLLTNPPFGVQNDMKRMTIWDITALIALLSPWIPDLLEIKIRHAILID